MMPPMGIARRTAAFARAAEHERYQMLGIGCHTYRSLFPASEPRPAGLMSRAASAAVGSALIALPAVGGARARLARLLRRSLGAQGFSLLSRLVRGVARRTARAACPATAAPGYRDAGRSHGSGPLVPAQAARLTAGFDDGAAGDPAMARHRAAAGGNRGADHADAERAAPALCAGARSLPQRRLHRRRRLLSRGLDAGPRARPLGKPGIRALPAPDPDPLLRPVPGGGAGRSGCISRAARRRA